MDKEALKRQKELIALQKKAQLAEKNKLSLSKAAAVFDTNRISIAAALKATYDKETKLRLEALQAIEEDNGDLALRKIGELAALQKTQTWPNYPVSLRSARQLSQLLTLNYLQSLKLLTIARWQKAKRNVYAISLLVNITQLLRQPVT
jgi:hypothetical protein